MMTERVTLKDTELANVSGGNYGDTAKDNGKTPMYKVGSVVEVFNTPFHRSTQTRRIIYAEKLSNGTWWYTLTSMGLTGMKWHTKAGGIERK